MKPSAKFFALMICLLLPCVSQAQRSKQPQKAAQAQQAGQIHCAHQEAYAYLYSSMATMDISTTLKCGQAITILDRSDNFFHVRTDTGEDGFVPASNIVFVKPGTAAAAPVPATKRELTHYDNPARLGEGAGSAAKANDLVLPNQTAVHLKLGRALSSATAHVGEEVPFEVAQDVVVGGRTVIAKGAPAVGAVTEVAPKGRMGKAGKLNVNVTSVLLANNEKAPLRSFGIDTNGEQKSALGVSLMKGKDITFEPGSEMTAYVDGDLHLKIASFAAATPPAAAQASSPQ